MPDIKFTVITDAPLKDVTVKTPSGTTRITLYAGVGTHDFATGTVCTAFLLLTGPQGTKAKFYVHRGETLLGAREHIKITSTHGKSTSTIPFIA
jgi:hypothetical protein